LFGLTVFLASCATPVKDLSPKPNIVPVRQSNTETRKSISQIRQSVGQNKKVNVTLQKNLDSLGVSLNKSVLDRKYLQDLLGKAKDDAHQQELLIDESNQRAEEAETHAAQTDASVTDLGKQIDTAHANEEKAVKYNLYAKPIVDKVNKYWGIGAIMYGFGRLFKHLIILALVVIGLAILAVILYFVMSFFFPAIMPFVRMVGSVLGSLFNKITSVFRK
jgi:DNA-binding protein YbaB